MISDVDKSLKKLLELELGAPLSFDISFAAPDKEFAPISNSQHTLNCYLYDISENRELRTNEPQLEQYVDGTYMRVPAVARVKLSYCITAWSPAAVTPAVDPAMDEHSLLSQVLKILLKYPELPNAALQGSLLTQTGPLPTSVILPNGIKNPGDFWNAIGGQLRPALDYSVTISLSYQVQETGPSVTAMSTIVKQIGDSNILNLTGGFLQMGGYIVESADPDTPIAGAQVQLLENAKIQSTDADGGYVFGKLPAGTYHVKATAPGFLEKTVAFTLPKADGNYNIPLDV